MTLLLTPKYSILWDFLFELYIIKMGVSELFYLKARFPSSLLCFLIQWRRLALFCGNVKAVILCNNVIYLALGRILLPSKIILRFKSQWVACCAEAWSYFEISYHSYGPLFYSVPAFVDLFDPQN